MCSPTIRRDKPKPELPEFDRDLLDDPLAAVPTHLRPSEALPNDTYCRLCGKKASMDEIVNHNGVHRNCDSTKPYKPTGWFDPNKPPVKIIFKKNILDGMPRL